MSPFYALVSLPIFIYRYSFAARILLSSFLCTPILLPSFSYLRMLFLSPFRCDRNPVTTLPYVLTLLYLLKFCSNSKRKLRSPEYENFSKFKISSSIWNVYTHIYIHIYSSEYFSREVHSWQQYLGKYVFPLKSVGIFKKSIPLETSDRNCNETHDCACLRTRTRYFDYTRIIVWKSRREGRKILG